MKYLILLFSIIQFQLHAQTISYTRRNARLLNDDGVAIVPEIGGMQHMLLASPGKPAILEIYNKDLRWIKEQEMPFTISSSTDVTILPFENFYYLFQKGAFYKIDSDGTSINENDKLRSLIKSSFYDSVATYQIFSKEDSIYICGFLYYPTLRKIIATVVKTNNLLEHPVITRIPFDFDREFEGLQKMILDPGKSLFVLKNHTTAQREFVLDLSKINLKNEEVYSSTFKSLTPLTTPNILYNNQDSSVTVFANLGRGYSTHEIKRRLFLATLGDSLQVRKQGAVIEIRLDSDVRGAFVNVYVDQFLNKWFPLYGTWNSLINPASNRRGSTILAPPIPINNNRSNTIILSTTSFQKRLVKVNPGFHYIVPEGDISFSVIQNENKFVYDTLVKWHRKHYIEQGQYEFFSINNQDHLIVKERFPSKGKSLLLLSPGNQGELISTGLHVYDKNYYSITDMVYRNNSIYIPYIYKREIGIVRIELQK